MFDDFIFKNVIKMLVYILFLLEFFLRLIFFFKKFLEKLMKLKGICNIKDK